MEKCRAVPILRRLGLDRSHRRTEVVAAERAHPLPLERRPSRRPRGALGRKSGRDDRDLDLPAHRIVVRLTELNLSFRAYFVADEIHRFLDLGELEIVVAD